MIGGARKGAVLINRDQGAEKADVKTAHDHHAFCSRTGFNTTRYPKASLPTIIAVGITELRGIHHAANKKSGSRCHVGLTLEAVDIILAAATKACAAQTVP